MTSNIRGFTEHQLLPFEYRERFLDYVEELAPEVLESLKLLVPKYKRVMFNTPSGSIAHRIYRKPEFEEFENEDARLRFIDYLIRVESQNVFVPYRHRLEAETDTWNRFVDLRSSFADFIQAYGLEAEWLREDYFSQLVDLAWGKKHVRHVAYASEILPMDEAESFEFVADGWAIDENRRDFEMRIRTEFSEALSIYVKSTIAYFRRLGYKQLTKPHDFSSVKWLVLWTVKRVPKNDILREIARMRPSTLTEEQLNARFRELEGKYDLPYRRMRGKSPRRKTA